MTYVLAIVLAAVALSALLAIAVRIARGGVGVPLAGGWRWHPSLLGIAVALLLGGLLMWRVLPELLLLPIIIPIFWWGRWGSKGRDQSDPDTPQGRLPPPDKH